MIGPRRSGVDTLIASRFAELEAQGHGPQRHEGAVTRQMLEDRVLHGIDPITGTTTDGVTGRRHRRPPVASRITSEASYVGADSLIRRSPEYRAAREAATFDQVSSGGYFSVKLAIEDVLGQDYLSRVEGLRRVRGTTTAVDVDFSRGFVRAIYRLNPDGEPVLVTLYPEER